MITRVFTEKKANREFGITNYDFFKDDATGREFTLKILFF